MPLTRQAAEADAVNALGADLLGAAGLATTADGAAAPNADLNGPLYRALDHLGYPPADPALVTDADLARVPPDRQVRLLDYLRIMVVDLATVRLASRPQRQEWEDYKVQYGDPARTLAALREALWAEYRRYLASGAPAVGKMDRESRRPLRVRGYFPPCPCPDPTPRDGGGSR